MIELESEVRRLAAVMEDTWNRNDIAGMFAVTTPDVHWVNVVGMHWQGQAAARHAHQVFFDLMFHDCALALEAIESIMPLPGGGAVTVWRWAQGGYRTPDGQSVPPHHSRMSVVLVPADDRLAIAHVANNAIDAVAAPHDPCLA